MSTLGVFLFIIYIFLRRDLLLNAVFTGWPVNPWDLLVSTLRLHPNTSIQM